MDTAVEDIIAVLDDSVDACSFFKLSRYGLNVRRYLLAVISTQLLVKPSRF